MKQADTHRSHSDQTFLSLGPLGWGPFFQTQLTTAYQNLQPARVTGVRKNIFQVRLADREIQASIAGRILHDPGQFFPAVGDWVVLNDTVITSVLTRKNALSRMASGRRDSKTSAVYSARQIIAANLDKVFILCGLDRDFNLRRIERYLTMVYNCGIEPVVILTKADLHQNPDDCVRQVEAISFGTAVYSVSADDSDTLLRLMDLLSPGQTVALVGSSGVGKSTLINRLSGKELQATGSVGDRVGKGKHTTTSRDLIILPSGAMIIDNPGIREIALTVDDESIDSAFPDIERLARSCRFTDCSHMHEPGCQVLAAVNCGEIPEERLRNFQKLKNEQIYLVQRESATASRVEKVRWKTVSQKIKCIKNRSK